VEKHFIEAEQELKKIEAVAGLFIGQEKQYHQFTISGDTMQGALFHNNFGSGNALLIDDETMLANFRAIQKRHHLPQSDSLAEKQFCVEMETGTGKTFVYTKTMLNFNKRYGFTKFIVVVPSVAICEGVLKSFQITDEHFSLMYDNG
jgi:type III restriction enzyme